MKKKTSSRITVRQHAELEALAVLPDDQIDTSDMAEVRDWSDAKSGLFHRPVKKQSVKTQLAEHIKRQARGRKAG